ncbi:MAG TPA: hypothetical protein VHN77_15315 [Phycisphaerales bacterium]|nr:hypothetical protein [Phycisphaerales bacterium]
MPIEPVPQLFQRLDDVPQRYKALTTELSDRLAVIERRLQSLPSKIEVEVEDFSHTHKPRLRFARGQDRWMLYYFQLSSDTKSDQLEWKPLLSCSVEEKMNATRLLSGLLGQIVSQQTRELTKVEGSLQYLDDVERALGLKEGA